MSDLKINCPICNQEFPAYDQRGFKNAGFTAHHKRCLERHQQPNEPQQRDQQASRASRFAWAVRRRLLPAHPTTSTSLVIEGQNRNSPQPPLSGSSSSSSSSSSPPNQADVPPTVTPVVPSQTPHSKQHLHPRQRHTWNHWSPRRRSRRSAFNVDTSPSTNTAAPSTNVHATTVISTLPDPRSVRPYCSLPVLDSAIDPPTFPLLTAITTLDSATALIIPQTASPPLSNQTPATSPMMSGSGSPFSFASMLTTLPVESAPLLPSTTISTRSSNSYSTNDRHSIDVCYPRPSPTLMDPSLQPDWMLGQYPPFAAADDGYHPYHHHHHGPYGPMNTNATLQRSTATMGRTYYHHHDTNNNTLFSAPPPHTLPRSLRSPENLDGNDDALIHDCGYCQPRNGQHDPSCSLMQFIMMDIIGGHDDPSSSPQ